MAAIHQGSYVTMNFLLFASPAHLLGAALQGQTPPESEIVAVWQLASLGEGDGRERQQRQQTDDGSRERVTHFEIPSL